MAKTIHFIISILNPYIQRFFSGNKRTLKVKRNILASAILKGIDVLIYLLLVPLTLGYLNSYEYGIWLTLNSILMWVNSFDIGLGNGLRNKLAVALATGDKKMGQIYVSTTFYALILLVIFIFNIIYVLNNYINWYSLLNVDVGTVKNLDEIIILSFAFFCLNFVFKFVGNIYLALQLPAVNSLLTVLGHALSLVIIYLISIFIPSNLLYVSITYSASPVIIYLIAFPITFLRVCKYLTPSFKKVRLKYLKDLMSIGIQFFFLQIAGIILFTSSNIILSRLLGPESVTSYNITYRYFMIIPLIFTILITPLWSAVTDAYTKGEIEWIKDTIGNIRKILLFTGILIIFMIIISKYIYKLWIGTTVDIPLDLTIFTGIYIYILVWSMSYSNFLNGLGCLRIQIINIIIVSILFYPLAVIFINQFKIVGMVMTMGLVNLSGAILNTVQFNRIIKGNAQGIWTK